MPNVKANGVRIEYDTFGDLSSPPLLLIRGLGTQMTDWEEDFCNLLADQGLFVIRFDNRDVGLSQKFEEGGVPDIMAALSAVMQGLEIQAPYSLDDMADDAIGLLDALEIKKAHIFGISMGSAITQIIGYSHPSRVLSLIPVMGSTGNPDLPPAKPEAMEVLLSPAPEEREAFIEHFKRGQRVIWGSLPFDEDDINKRAAVSYERSNYPQGVARQLVATISNGNRKPRLTSITAPTLVIHGAADPLIPFEGGRDTAEAIPGAVLLKIEGMGHCLPRAAWPQIVEAIAVLTKKASAKSG
ncbi:MAG: alpha/beta hydrolase [Deltaproteobacteria bacterium]|nr:alpha/beta hydrolase [Deltaproteobacteria bacterium]